MTHAGHGMRTYPHSPEGGYAGIEIGRAHFSGAEVPVADRVGLGVEVVAR